MTEQGEAERAVAAGTGRDKSGESDQNGQSAAGRRRSASAARAAAGPSGRGRTPGRRPGRRPGSADTRGEILAAARRTFAEKGFEKATIRGIAREAGVDPALVHHYFDNKEGLFVAAMRLPLDPSRVVTEIVTGPREEVGRRLARFLLTVVDDPEAREPMVGMFRAAMSNEQAAATVREFFTQAVFARVTARLGAPAIGVQAALSQMSGLIIVRYILRVEPLASADIDELVDLVGPTLQRYLVG